jgi:signal transduction histidine kinase
VEENLQDMTNFVHNAGHELKTPLAVMRGNLQIMQAEETYDKLLLKKSIREIDNTNSLLEGLIELSQV